MGLRVAVQVMVTSMDGNEVVNVMQMDTVINTSPADPTAEPVLAKQTMERLAGEVAEASGERLNEYAQYLARMLGGQMGG